MAASSSKKESRRSGERLASNNGPGTSRVSGAAGSVGSQRAISTHVEQQSSVPGRQRSGKQSARGRASASSNARSKAGTGQSGRRSSSAPRPSQNPPAGTGDARFINWLFTQWGKLEAHQRQSVYGALLLVLSLLLFASLTVLHKAVILSSIADLFVTFFGWAAYPLALGLVVFAVAHLIEGIQNRPLIRWSLVIGSFCILLLLLLESRLFLGPMRAGVTAELLIGFLLGWPGVVQHILLLGLLILAIVVTFRIRFGHILLAVATLQNLLRGQTSGKGDEEEGPSPFLGQRPRYSRYGNGSALPDEDAPPAQQGSGTRKRRRAVPLQNGAADAEDEGNIDFEADFELDDDDPRNDINLHKGEIGLVPRGPREPAALDLTDRANALRDVVQQPLMVHEDAEAPQPSKRPARKLSAMEPLQPNPLRKGSTPASAGAANGPPPESPWKIPDTSLLHNPENVKLQMIGEDTATLARTIQETLRSFRVDAEVREADISIGPTVIRFGIRPTGKPEMTQDDKGRPVPVRDGTGNIVYETRTRVSRIMALQNDLALVLEAKTIRMEAPVPGRPYVGVEIPNKNSRLVTLREVLESKEYHAAKAKSMLAVALGKDVAGLVRVSDLARMPHLLIAGATGSGKSVMINVIIASLLFQATPEDVRLLMVDPKMVELNMYNGIPHLLSPVVTEVEKVVPLLRNAIAEMERRYRLFSQLGVRNLDSYRKLRAEKSAKGDSSLANMPAIIIIIDELADLMMAAPEEVEGMICRLAQLARATGIHLVVATQRPSVDVITGLIKANIPTRISFMVSSSVDSRTIIDMGGAERLLGRGDMLYLPADAGRPERIQGAFLADDEVETLVMHWRQQFAEQTSKAMGSPNENVDPAAPTQALSLTAVEPGWEIKEEPDEGFVLDDELLEQAEEVVRDEGRASISLLQRRLRIGYSRAARLIDLLEEHGIIGPSEQGGRSREVFESSNSDRHSSLGDVHSMADEAADIVAAERDRNEFLRKQAEGRKSSPQ